MAKTQTKAFTNAKPIVLPAGGAPEWCAIEVEFAAAAYVAADLIQVATIPAGYRVLDWALAFPDIDTGIAAVAWSFGVANNTLAVPVSTDIGAALQVWGSALTAGQTDALVRNVSSNCSQDAIVSTATIPGDREIVLKCTTAAATYAGAAKVGRVLLLLQG